MERPSVELVQDDFNIFNANGATSAAYVTQKEHYALPIRTYAELGLDSFESIVGAFAKINEIGEELRSSSSCARHRAVARRNLSLY